MLAWTARAAWAAMPLLMLSACDHQKPAAVERKEQVDMADHLGVFAGPAQVAGGVEHVEHRKRQAPVDQAADRLARPGREARGGPALTIHVEDRLQGAPKGETAEPQADEPE